MQHIEIYNEFKFAIPLFGDNEIWITQTTVATWIIGLILIGFAIITRVKLNSFTDRPKGFQNVIELSVEAMEDFTSSTIDPKFKYLGTYFYGAFAFILASNFSGLFHMRPPTADLSVTFGFAIVTFFLIHFLGIKQQKAEYFKEYLKPMPLFLPIHLIGEVAAPISLSFRLFGAILSGLIILSLV